MQCSVSGLMCIDKSAVSIAKALRCLKAVNDITIENIRGLVERLAPEHAGKPSAAQALL